MIPKRNDCGIPKQRRVAVDGVLFLDKPAGLSSTQALGRVKWLLNAAKAGHTGTLDPFATGLLPLCFGEATKFSADLLNADKSYRATMRLGQTTDTGDCEGKITRERLVDPLKHASRVAMAAVLQAFTGEISQIPPMYSALKRDGKPLYAYAREGVTLERAPRAVTIHALDLVAVTGSEAIFDVRCSKGTYVRTLAEDIGEKLGCGAHLTALRRTGIADLLLEQAVSLEAVEALAPAQRTALLQPVDALLAKLPVIHLGHAESIRLCQGQSVPLPDSPDRLAQGTLVRLYGGGAGTATLLGTGAVVPGGMVQPVRLAHTRHSSPSPQAMS